MFGSGQNRAPAARPSAAAAYTGSSSSQRPSSVTGSAAFQAGANAATASSSATRSGLPSASRPALTTPGTSTSTSAKPQSSATSLRPGGQSGGSLDRISSAYTALDTGIAKQNAADIANGSAAKIMAGASYLSNPSSSTAGKSLAAPAATTSSASRSGVGSSGTLPSPSVAGGRAGTPSALTPTGASSSSSGTASAGSASTAPRLSGSTAPSTASSSGSGSGPSSGGSGAAAGTGHSPHGLVRRERLKFALNDLALSTTVGTGTFGRVRIAYHKPSKQWHVLKILKKSEVIRLKQVEHIKDEVRILGKVYHPFIVNMLGLLQDDRRMYMLLEYVPGGELFSHLRREGKFSETAARFYASEIALAFEYLHMFNIVYRDLKPENLLLTAKGHVKITDFGFAKVVEDRTYTLCGTPEYLAPEIIQSKGHNKGVDWWAIGILIYEMLAGYPPFYDESPYGIYQKILKGNIEWPRNFSAEAKDLIKKLLTADRTKRLGCLHKGAADVKEHPWFARLNWDTVYSCGLAPPYVPRVREANDTSNFDEYPDSDGDTAQRLQPSDAAQFAELDNF